MSKSSPLSMPVCHIVARQSFVSYIWTQLSRFVTLVDRVAARARSRAHLAKLPDNLLRDIGISRTEAQTEARRSFWH